MNMLWGTRVLTLEKNNLPFGYIAMFGNDKLWPAIGGVRILEQEFDYHDGMSLAMDLAKTMYKKASHVDMPMAGAKSILYLPKDKNRSDILKCFADALNQLNGKYIAAVDIGSDSNDMNFLSKHTNFVTCNTKSGGDPSYYTALSVLQGILAACNCKFKVPSLNDKKIIVQGIGKVGAHLVNLIKSRYQHVNLFIYDMLSEKCHSVCSPDVKILTSKNIYQTPCDIFISAASSRIIDEQNALSMQCGIFASAANNPFETKNVIKILASNGCLVLPDYLINTGGLLHCAYQYDLLTKEQVFQKINNVYFNIESFCRRKHQK